VRFSSLRFPNFSKAKEAHESNETLVPTTFNPMASLSLVPLAHTAQNLFMRGAPFIIPFNQLLAYFIVFFLLAALTAGSAIPSGLLLPQIVMGGLIGRMYTLVMILVQMKFPSLAPVGQDHMKWTDEYNNFFRLGVLDPKQSVLMKTGFPDPGIGAIIGAAAFLGGSGRIALFIVAMLVEITGDPLIILPVAISTMTAIVVANKFNHGLYHILIDLQSFPYLPDRWPIKRFPAVRIKDYLPCENVVTVPLAATRQDVRNLLSEHEYLSFPVVDEQGVVIGIAERRFLENLVWARRARHDFGPSVIPRFCVSCRQPTSNRGCISCKGRVCRSCFDNHSAMCVSFQEEQTSGIATEEAIGSDDFCVGVAMDPYPPLVRNSLLLTIAYDVFKRMEGRRLIAVDDANRPTAVLTRKSVLPWAVVEKLDHRNHNETFQSFRDFFWRRSEAAPA
jgi:chloride channel 7